MVNSIYSKGNQGRFETVVVKDMPTNEAMKSAISALSMNMLLKQYHEQSSLILVANSHSFP